MNYYSNQQKARAMQVLIEHIGNTRRASELTGIPERTLQRWRSEFTPTTILKVNNDDPANQEEAIVQGRYHQIRNTLIDHVQNVSAQIYENPEQIADLTITYGRLLDRLVKAQTLVTANSFKIIILWEGPEAFNKLTQDIEF